MEMSTFHHHLWCVRSRYCAWDHPNRSHKRFIDLHIAENENSRTKNASSSDIRSAKVSTQAGAPAPHFFAGGSWTSADISVAIAGLDRPLCGVFLALGALVAWQIGLQQLFHHARIQTLLYRRDPLDDQRLGETFLAAPVG